MVVGEAVKSLVVSTITVATVAVFVAPNSFQTPAVVRDLSKFMATAIAEMLGTRRTNTGATGLGVDIVATFNMMGDPVVVRRWYDANYPKLSAAERTLAEQWLATH